MNRHLFTVAFILGALGIIWAGVGFVDSSLLALSITAVIGAVYGYGSLELRQYRQATSSLSDALAAIPDNLADLGDWLGKLPPSLRDSVRLRVEGERVGLPGPALTPYLVGLLVMLGMLGTFLGMVVTLKGAVFALESTTDLQAIRSALSVPVKGLGLAFGTSVAGVAASAMLGLMSALCRRDRMQAAQQLDAKIATVLRRFSSAHQHQETFKALQLQSEALPQVVDKLQAMMTQMESMSQQLNQRLVGNQEDFHSHIKGVYTDLAGAVDKSLRASLSQGAQAAADSIKPVVEAAMSGIAREAELTHQRTADTVQAQLDGMAARMRDSASAVADTWMAALNKQELMSQRMTDAMQTQMDGMSARMHDNAVTVADTWMAALSKQELMYQRMADAMQAQLDGVSTRMDDSAATVADTWMSALSKQELMNQRMMEAMQVQLDGMAARMHDNAATVAGTWTTALNKHEEANTAIVADVRRSLESFSETFEQRSDALVVTVGGAYAKLQTGQAERDRERQEAWAKSLEDMAASLAKELQHTGASTLAQQKEICDSLILAVQGTTQQAEALAAALRQELQQTGTQTLAQQKEICDALALSMQDTTQQTQALAAAFRQELQQTGKEALAQQQVISDTLTRTVQDITQQVQSSADKSLTEAARLITSAEDLMRSRIEVEARWMEQHSVRMDQLATLLQSELGALKEQEAARGQAAVERLGQLQAAVAGHLTTLGTALEEPIARLIETASEAPRAAADVIGQLRREISNSVARDNELLEERSRIMETLNTLLEAINHASHEQRAVIDSLVASATAALQNTAGSFSENVAAEAGKLTDIAAQVTSSAVEVSSLSEAFGVAVNSFNEANEKLIGNLERIEGAMDKTMSRSDEQLAYYVAQAREIIDLSMMSQKEIIEGLRRIPAKQVVVDGEIE